MRGFRGWGWRGPGPPVGIPFALNDQSPQAQGLVAWWPTLGSAGANILRDFSGRGLHGAFVGSGKPAWVGDAQFGMTLSFNGTNDYVNVRDDDNLDVTGSSLLTVTAWIKPTLLTNSNMIASKWNSLASGAGWQFNFNAIAAPNKLQIWLRNSASTDWNYIENTASFSPGDWYYIAATINAGTIKLYKSGQEIAGTMTGSALNASNSLPLQIGIRGGTHHAWSGSINEVCIYAHALSAAEVWQQWAPESRWDLYRPLLRRLWAMPSAGGDAPFQRSFSPAYRGVFG